MINWQDSLCPQILSKKIDEYYLLDEQQCLEVLLSKGFVTESQRIAVRALSEQLVQHARTGQTRGPSVENFLKTFSLDTQEGVALMCLAEVFSRIPDTETAQTLLQDKLTRTHLEGHLGHNRSFWVNASTWGLLLTGRLFHATPEQSVGVLRQVVQRLGSTIVVSAVQQAMHLIGEQFIFAQSLEQGLKATASGQQRYTFDIYGGVTLTLTDGNNNFETYRNAIEHIAQTKHFLDKSVHDRPILSIKLSTLCPHFQPWQKGALFKIQERLLALAVYAQKKQVVLSIDAEESERLEPLLYVFAQVFAADELNDWPYLGIAVQSYQKRALPVLEWLRELSKRHKKSIPLRLVKGAYWDLEIKKAQQLGISNYPVYTRKSQSDLSYLACSRYLLANLDYFFPQFATHNVHTLASVLTYADVKDSQEPTRFEIQRFYGMGKNIFDKLHQLYPNVPYRIHAPVGPYKQLLPYLVRRLLENNANSSFIRALNDNSIDTDQLIQEPSVLITVNKTPSPIPLPKDLFAPHRLNSSGLNLNSLAVMYKTMQQIEPFLRQQRMGKDLDQLIRNPANKEHILGCRNLSTAKDCQQAVQVAYDFFPKWKKVSADHRAQLLDSVADHLEKNRYELMALLITEAGKTLLNAHNEIREAVDYCRYYASQCRDKLCKPIPLPGITGEENTLLVEGRGVFLCISPWNFPLSIMVGQIAAALVTGNCVIAKPATDGELVARRTAELFFEAGFPKQALQFAPCSARIFATTLLSDERIAGTAFTGSIDTAQIINFQLAQRSGSLATIIMETGGLNSMIVDSTALPEQVVRDIIVSAFDSTGQRCSALRVVFLQEEIAPLILDLLKARLETLRVGDPLDLNTDIGPVINENAFNQLQTHIKEVSIDGKFVCATQVAEEVQQSGYYIPPTIIEIKHISALTKEVFGPILHVIRFSNDQWDDVIKQISCSHYGLTLGIHTRIDSRAEELAQKIGVGNVYINRHMIGATVGSQPFGGQGLSGTGPKAGGPLYLFRFSAEKTISNNITAMGANPSLLASNKEL